MMAEQGDKFTLEKIDLAELERRTRISRTRLHQLKKHGFDDTEHATMVDHRYQKEGFPNTVFTSNCNPAQREEITSEAVVARRMCLWTDGVVTLSR